MTKTTIATSRIRMSLLRRIAFLLVLPMLFLGVLSVEADGQAVTKTFCVKGTSNGRTWTWDLSGVGLPSQSVTAPAVANGGNATALAQTWVNSINAVQGNPAAFTARFLRTDEDGTACFTITAVRNFKFGVDGCTITNNPAGCSFNPTVVEVGQNPPCLGKGIIRLNRRGKEWSWRLTCAGNCPGDGQCKPQPSTDHHGGLREWCGCPGVPEPADCHVVKITPGKGEGGGPPSFVCAGACPVTSDVCTEHRDVLARYRNGKPKRIVFSCECENPARK